MCPLILKIPARVGRNERCPCQSGKKFKHCCGRDPKTTNVRIGNEIDRILERAYQMSGVSPSPGCILLEDVPRSKVTSGLEALDHIISKLSEDSSVRWNRERLNLARSTVHKYLEKTSRLFTPRFCNHALYEESIRVDPLVATVVFWNDLDQYKYMFRSRMRALLTERVFANLNNAEDPVTALGIQRQLLETAYNAIACQWVFTTVHNHFSRNGKNYAKGRVLTSSDLEEFAILITCWNRNQAKALGELLGDPMSGGDRLKKEKYRPATDKLQGVAEFVAKSFEEAGCAKLGELTCPLNRLKAIYPFLCKFAHPSPMMFPIDDLFFGSEDLPSDSKVRVAASAGFLEVMECVDKLMTNLFFDPVFDRLRFADLMLSIALGYKGSQNVISDIKLPFIPQFMNQFDPKIVIDCLNGPLEIFKRS